VGTTASGPISFVASAGAAGSAATEKVTVPGAVTAGDGMLLAATGVTTFAADRGRPLDAGRHRVELGDDDLGVERT